MYTSVYICDVVLVCVKCNVKHLYAELVSEMDGFGLIVGQAYVSREKQGDKQENGFQNTYKSLKHQKTRIGPQGKDNAVGESLYKSKSCKSFKQKIKVVV